MGASSGYPRCPLLIHSHLNLKKMNSLRNKVQLIGYLGNTPELKSLESGNTLAKFSIATNETYLNSDGEKVSNTTWHSLVAWGKLADRCGQLLKKGSEVVIEGKLVTRSYQNEEGVKRYITEIHVNEMLLVGGKASAKAKESETENELHFSENS